MAGCRISAGARRTVGACILTFAVFASQAAFGHGAHAAEPITGVMAGILSAEWDEERRGAVIAVTFVNATNSAVTLHGVEGPAGSPASLRSEARFFGRPVRRQVRYLTLPRGKSASLRPPRAYVWLPEASLRDTGSKSVEMTFDFGPDGHRTVLVPISGRPEPPVPSAGAEDN